MRKVYVKPEIEFEDFSLSTNIAGGCNKIVGNPSKESCGIIGSDNVTILFGSNYGGCNFDWESLYGDNYDGYCYHNPSDSTDLFNS